MGIDMTSLQFSCTRASQFLDLEFLHKDEASSWIPVQTKRNCVCATTTAPEHPTTSALGTARRQRAMICSALTALVLFASVVIAAPQGQAPGSARQFDYEYFYDDLPGPDFAQPAPQQPVTATRPRSRAEAAPRAPAPPSTRPLQQGSRQAGDVTTTTHIPILKDSRRTDPVTGAFIYDYMGADGSGKYEVRYTNGTVLGNFTYINDAGERETRWYSAGERGTEIEGDSVISPAPPTLIDETTGKNYVDLSNYDLYRHLEVPYVHLAGPSDPDERGQLSRPGAARPADDRRQQFQSRPQPQQPPQPAIDFGDETRFVAQEPRVQAPQPSRVSRTRTRVAEPTAAAAPRQNFDASALDTRSPDHVLDSLIQQFQ
ncbi:Insect cuticle protein [Trinorchestia longiramus]|nr:Insect cuticle protein [Trinorchestia longiramus]